MGCDYSAKGCLGILLPDENNIPRAQLSVRKKAFNHQYNDGDAEFDPKTGQKLFLDEKEIVQASYPAVVYYDTSDLKKGQIALTVPEGLSLTSTTDNQKTCFGFVVRAEWNSDYGFAPLPDIMVIKKKIFTALEPLGLWDESKFGLHSLLYCSY
jgi:hypothetical protein